MVPDLGGVVEEFALGGAHDVLEWQVLILGAGNELVQVVHVGLMVLAVMVFDGLGGDVRAQRVLGEWQWWKLDHNGSPIKCYDSSLASLGPDATLRPELFRRPCQRMRLLVHERFCPVHGSRRRSGGRGDATPQVPAR